MLHLVRYEIPQVCGISQSMLRVELQDRGRASLSSRGTPAVLLGFVLVGAISGEQATKRME